MRNNESDLTREFIEMQPTTFKKRRPYWTYVLIAGLLIGLSMGLRQTFGLFQLPLTESLGIGRADFAFSMAILNIIWGIAQPPAGMIADKFGPGRVIFVGGIVYAFGTLMMANASGTFDLVVGAGFGVGFGTAATGFSVVLGALGRLVPAERRSIALALASTGGSIGQFLVIPYGQYLISSLGWSQALLVIAGLAALMSPLALIFSSSSSKTDEHRALSDDEANLSQALREAFRSKSFWYLNLGFGVCGFQVLFIAVHFPAYIIDSGLPPQTGAIALALIGFFNILGTMACGYLAPIVGRKYLLSALYFLRGLIIVLLLILPATTGSFLVVASMLGLLWLGTVPVTGDLVANLFGARYMSSLFGIVFLSHQIGGFAGVWAGGLIYDLTRSYDPVWYTCIGLGVVAGIIHLPISERHIEAKTVVPTPLVGSG